MENHVSFAGLWLSNLLKVSWICSKSWVLSLMDIPATWQAGHSADLKTNDAVVLRIAHSRGRSDLTMQDAGYRRRSCLHGLTHCRLFLMKGSSAFLSQSSSFGLVGYTDVYAAQAQFLRVQPRNELYCTFAFIFCRRPCSTKAASKTLY